MIVKLTVEATEIQSSVSVELTLDYHLYNRAVRRINELAEELSKIHDEFRQEDN